MFTHIQKKKTERKKKRDQKDKKGRNSKRAGAKEILEMKKSIWENGVRNNASVKGLESYNRAKGGLYT